MPTTSQDEIFTDHFSTIGLSKFIDDIDEVIGKLKQDAVEIPCEWGRYSRWSSGDGAEVWIQEDDNGELVGATPYFRGSSESQVRIISEVSQSDDTPLEGAVHCWADPDETNWNAGAFPFVFAVVDKGIHSRFNMPFESTIRLSAFAHTLEVHATEQEFMDSQDKETKFAPQFFIPTGLFEAESSGEVATPFAKFAGTILDARVLKNPLTGELYQWMQVRTHGEITVDVVAHPTVIEKPPVIGGTAAGQFWLCGEVLEPKYRGTGFWSRLFG